jgi:hypothetical protein
MPLTPVGRVSFESVFEPTAMQEGQEKKYGVTLIFPKKLTGPQLDLLKQMKQAANEACQEKFGCDLGGNYKGKPLRNPFRDGAEKPELDGYGDDVFFVRFSGRARPHVVDAQKHAISKDSGDFYNGCYSHLTYTVYTYTKGTPGVAFGLVNIQKVKDGEQFGAGVSNPDNDFDELEGQDSLAELLA